MFHHVVAQNTNKILARSQNGYTTSEVLQLAAEVEDRESKESVHRRVSNSGQEDGDGLNDVRQLELRARICVVKIISLQRQRLARIREIRQVPCQQQAEIRKNDDHDKRQHHHNISADDDRPSDLRSSYHHVPFLHRF